MTSTPLKTSDISVIIPTLNEAPRIGQLANQLAGNVGETIVVDGGSRDQTVREAEHCGLTVLICRPGRARQMNAGGAAARGAILLFLHADTLLPARFAESILRCLADRSTALCAFSLGVDSEMFLLRVIVAAANLRSRVFKLPYGDQALALRSATFRDLGGFPELPIMEDYELVRQARQHGAVVTLPERVLTSGRRWQRLGVLQTTLINQLVVAGFKLGIPPERLASLYRGGLFRSN